MRAGVVVVSEKSGSQNFDGDRFSDPYGNGHVRYWWAQSCMIETILDWDNSSPT